jgi:hypothetical protein
LPSLEVDMHGRTLRNLASLLLCAAAALPARAGLDIDLSASVAVGDRSKLYVAVNARYFDADPVVVGRFAARCEREDDLAVALFIARHSDRSLDSIFSMRGKGLSWWAISVNLGLPAEVWMIPVKREPGPPYGKAYGYWKKHGRDTRAYELSDDDLRHLVSVRVLSEYFGVSAEIAMDSRASGRPLSVLVEEAYQRNHGNKQKAEPGPRASTTAAKSTGAGAQPASAGGKSAGNGAKPGKSQGKSSK